MLGGVGSQPLATQLVSHPLAKGTLLPGDRHLSPQLAAILLRDQVRQLAADSTAGLLVEQKALAALEISDRAYILVAGQTRIEGLAANLLARQHIGELFLGRAAALG